MANKHRYFVTFTIEIIAESDRMATQKGIKICHEHINSMDDRCTLNSIVRKDFGEVTETEIYKKEV